MKGFAQLTFVGQIRKEPEYNVLRSGAEVANFEIAFCEKAGEDNWIWTNMRVALFGKSVETLKKYFTEKMWVKSHVFFLRMVRSIKSILISFAEQFIPHCYL